MRAFPFLAVVLIGCSSDPMMMPPGTQTVDAAKSTVTLDKVQLVADNTESVRVTVSVRDADNKPVRDAKVNVTISGTKNTPDQSNNTGDDGVTNANFSSEKAETKTLTISAELNGTTTDLGTKSVTFVAGPAAAMRFKVQPTNTKAGVAMSPAVELEVTDGRGNPVGSDTTFMASVRLVRSNGGSVQNGAARAPVDGVITFDNLIINRPQQGYALRAEAANGAADESMQFDVTVGDLSAATSTLVANPVNVVGAASTTLTLTARDVGNNVLANVPVTFDVSGTGNTVGTPSTMTAADGTASTTLSSTVTETKTVTATVGTVSLTVNVTFVP